MHSGNATSTTITRTTTSVRRSTTIRRTNATGAAAGGAAEGSSDYEYPITLMDNNRSMDESPARPSPAEAARAARRNRISSSPSAAAAIISGGDSSGSPVRKSTTTITGIGNDSSTTATAMSTPARDTSSGSAGRARRREARSAGSGHGNQRVVASRSSSSAASTGAGGGTSGRAGRTPSPSPTDLAAAFDDLAPPPPPPPLSSRASTSRHVAAAAAAAAGAGSRRSGNTVASSSVVAATSQGGTMATNVSGARSISTAAADDADLSPEAVAKEFVMKRQHQQRGQVAARGGVKADTNVAVSSSAAAVMNGHGPNKTPTTSDNATEEAMAREIRPARSRNTAAVRNYVSGRVQSPSSARPEAGTNASTARSTTNASGTAAGARGGASNNTTTSSPTFAISGTKNTRYTSTTRNALQKKKQIQIDTARRARGGRGGDASRAGVGISSPASSSAAASPETHVGSIGSSSLGPLASPSSPDSLAYSNTHSFSKSSRSTGGGGGDLLSGKATNDIPSPERATSRRKQQEKSKDRTESTQQRMMTAQTSRAPGTVYSFADDNDDGTNTESMASRYDDLSKLSSRHNRHNPLMAPVDEAVGANPNGTSVSYDSYENDNAIAIVYGTASASGGGASVSGASQGGVSQSFSPGLGVSFSPSQSAGAGGQYALEDEDNHSQLTDDRSWSRSVNLRQQHLRGHAGGAKDDDQSSVMNGGRYLDSSNSKKQEGSGKNDGSSRNTNGDEGLTDWALNADDWKHFKEQVDQPQVKGALGASAAVVAGGKFLYNLKRNHVITRLTLVSHLRCKHFFCLTICCNIRSRNIWSSGRASWCRGRWYRRWRYADTRRAARHA